MSYAMDFTSPAGTQTFADGAGSVLALIRTNGAAQATMFAGSTFTGLLDGTIRVDATFTKFQKSLSGTFSDMPMTNILGFTAAPLASPNFTGTPQIGGVNIATTANLSTYAPLASPTFTGTVNGAAAAFTGALSAAGITSSSGLTVTGGSGASFTSGSFSTTLSVTGNLTTAAQNLAVVGSVTAPSYSFSTYTGIGFYSAAANTMSIANNSIEQWRFDNSHGQYIPFSNNAAQSGQIGGQAYGDSNPQRCWIIFSTTVGSGGSDSNIQLYTNHYGTSAGVRVTIDKDGNLTGVANVAGYGSDERLKENWKPISNHWEVIEGIGGYTFDWREDKCHAIGFHPVAKREHGFGAQTVRRLFPEAVAPMVNCDVDENGEHYLTIMREKLIPLHNVALTELNARLRAVEVFLAL